MTSVDTSTIPPSRATRDWRRVAVLLTFAAIVVLADQWSKMLVRTHLEIGETWPGGWEIIRFTHLENSGAAFGILQGAGGALMVVGLGAVAAIMVVLLMLPSTNPIYTFALSGILGGTVGNLIDRLRLGAVTDFIDPAFYPAFNIADSAIVVSVGALLVLTWLQRDTPTATEREHTEVIP